MKNKRKGFTISELLMVFAIVCIVGFFLMPVIRYNRIRRDKAVCANNLRQIGLAMYIYAREHEGRFPDTLKTLYDDQYLADVLLMDCPASKSAGTPGMPDYLYTSGLKIRSSSVGSLVWDKAKNHGNTGKNILHVNGDVLWKKNKTGHTEPV